MELQGILQDCYDPTNRALRVTSSDEGMFLGPGDLQVLSGTSVLTTGGNVARRNMPDAATTVLGATFGLPKWWKYFGVAILWIPEVAAAGNVRFTVDVKRIDIGISGAGAGVLATSSYNAASGGNTNIKYNTDGPINIDATPAAFGSAWSVALTRTGGDAVNDTYNNAIGIVNLVVRRNTGP